MTLEALRRQRGEGWQWARVQTDRCPQCGLHPGAMDPTSLGDALMELAGQWRVFLDDAEDAYLRTIPAPGVFSPIQYGAHVRDIVRVYGDRIVLMLAEDDPTFPQFNPPEDTWEAYNSLGPAELADDLEDEARRLAGIMADLGPAQWARTMTRDGGSDGVHRFTVAGLGSYAVHEAHHHLLDAMGALRPLVPRRWSEQARARRTQGPLQPEERLAALEERVRTLEDHLAVLRVVNSWGPAVDTGSAAAAAGIWADEGVLDSDLSRLEGPDDVAAMVKSPGQQELIARGCAHVQAAPVVTVDGDRAAATAYSQVFLHSEEGHEIWRVSANRWELRRSAQGWRVTSRTNRVIEGGPEARDVLLRAFGTSGPET